MADGIAAAELAMVLLDASPEPHELDDPGSWRIDPAPAPVYGVARDIGRLAQVSLRLAAWGGWTALHPLRRSRNWVAKAGAMTSLLRAGLVAPRSPLNDENSPSREVHVVRLSFDEVRQLAHAHGATVNDVVLTIVAQGLHALLVKRAALDNTTELQALVPVGLDAGPGRGLGNRVSAFLVRLPVALGDPTSALMTIGRKRAATRRSTKNWLATLFCDSSSLSRKASSGCWRNWSASSPSSI